jgi:hypothetical protein
MPISHVYDECTCKIQLIIWRRVLRGLLIVVDLVKDLYHLQRN